MDSCCLLCCIVCIVSTICRPQEIANFLFRKIMKRRTTHSDRASGKCSQHKKSFFLHLNPPEKKSCFLQIYTYMGLKVRSIHTAHHYHLISIFCSQNMQIFKGLQVKRHNKKEIFKIWDYGCGNRAQDWSCII